MPDGLEIICNDSMNIEWLASHPEMLFPATAKLASDWFKGIQHHAQNTYFKDRSCDCLVLGRRRMDGNFLGPGGIYTNKRGVTRYSPIREWSHEHVLALCHYYDYPLAPCYNWPRGFQVGTGAWPARQWCESIQAGWAEVYEIDPAVVAMASSWIESAHEFMQTRSK
jgi:hypothetical protein